MVAWLPELIKLNVLEYMTMKIKLLLIIVSQIQVQDSHFSIFRNYYLWASILIERCLVNVAAFISVKSLLCVSHVIEWNFICRRGYYQELTARAKVNVGPDFSVGLKDIRGVSFVLYLSKVDSNYLTSLLDLSKIYWHINFY